MKDLITLTQALALRDLGYDEQCLCAINEEGYTIIPNDTRFITESSGYKKYHTRNMHLTKRPTRDSAFRWFRENHGIILKCINPCAFGYYWRLDNTPKTPMGVKYVDNRYEQNTGPHRGNDKVISSEIQDFFPDYDDCVSDALNAMITLITERRDAEEEKKLDDEL